MPGRCGIAAHGQSKLKVCRPDVTSSRLLKEVELLPVLNLKSFKRIKVKEVQKDLMPGI